MHLGLSGLGLRTGVACMVLAALGLGTGMAVAPPPTEMLLPLLAVLLGLVGGMTALLAGTHVATRSVAPPRHDGTDHPATADLQTVARDLRALLEEQRGEVASIREQGAAAGHDTAVLCARLAGVALDAETRLSAAVGRAGEAAQRAERALPEFAELLRRGLSDQIRPAPQTTASSQSGGDEADRVAAADTAAARLEQATAGAVRSLTAVMADAAGQIAAVADVAAVLRRDAAGLDAAAREVAAAGAGVVSRVGEAVGHADAALAQLPGCAAAVTAAAAQTVDATQLLGEASAALRADAAALDAAGREAVNMATNLHQEANTIRVAGADAAGTAQAAALRLGDMTAMAERIETAATDAAAVLQNTSGLTALVSRLTTAAAALADGTAALHTAGRGVEAAGQAAADHLAAEAARITADMGSQIDGQLTIAAEASLRSLPHAAAEMTAAAASLRQEVVMAISAARQTSEDSADAAVAMASAAARVEVSAAALDAVGHAVCAASGEVGAQIARLDATARHTETQAVLLPDAAARLADSAARFEALARSWPAQIELAALPNITAHLAAAVPQLDRLDGLGAQFASLAAELPARLDMLADEMRTARDAATRQHIQDDSGGPTALTPALTMLGTLATEISQATRRLDTLLDRHDGAGQELIASMARVQDAVMGVAEAAALSRPVPPAYEPALNEPAALAETLHHLDGVSAQTSELLRQTDALAETVLAGRAPDLPPLLAVRTPALLTVIETTIQQLHSVATALALASDGPTAAAVERMSA